jgi:hypothetical protein
MERACNTCTKEHEFVESALANYEVIGKANS